MNASDSPPVVHASFADKVAKWCDDHPVLLFTVLTFWYVGLVWKYTLRPLWYDELFTYYIAQQPNVARMMQAIRSVDLNPPLNYFLTRWSLQLFGSHTWVARLPGLSAFWAGCLAIFLMLRARTDTLIATLGVLLFWSNPYFLYASEARPYGLLLGLTAVLLASWDYAARECRRWALVLVFCSAVLLLLSHVFGVLTLAAIWAAEAVRSFRRRRIDWPMLFAVMLPIFATLTYRAMLHTVQHVVFPPESQASWAKLYFTYFAVFRWMWRPLAIVALLIVWKRDRTIQPPAWTKMPAALAGLFFIPLGVVILFMQSHGAFFDRYGMAGVIPVVMLPPLLLWRWTNGSANAAGIACACVGLLVLLSTTLRPGLVRAASEVFPPKLAVKAVGILATSEHGPFRPWWKKLDVPQELQAELQRAPAIDSFDHFHPELPIVPANELTFVEMDNRTSERVSRRLYYTYDHDSEVKIAHRYASVTVLTVQPFFPLRGTVLPYVDFTADHRQFLVVGTWEHSGDWLLRKLVEDGARLSIVARVKGYADESVFFVDLSGPHK